MAVSRTGTCLRTAPGAWTGRRSPVGHRTLGAC